MNSSTTLSTVSDDWISRALVLLLERAKLVVEPAGAAAVAAVLADPTAFEPWSPFCPAATSTPCCCFG